ncbi:hypothetical protein RHMOL_Rhmol03G0044700 [Rhododendron molle]|uniref:Uncharacterized protein n=1 Tax=Rhododendron molle TaxID=49168 RepID=A0ACC0PBJ1_RHOML|nr:hypothetical protein RHMOL_Rhmol03G0044700 [Rhododendron molle]
MLGIPLPQRERERERECGCSAEMEFIICIFIALYSAEEGIHGAGSLTAIVTALRAVHVPMGLRSMASGKEDKEDIVREIPTAKIEAMGLDLNLLSSVRKLASEFNSLALPLNLLVNHATPFMFSKDEIELQFAINHLGKINLKKTVWRTPKEGRIVNASSRRLRYSYSEGIRLDQINGQSGKSSSYSSRDSLSSKGLLNHIAHVVTNTKNSPVWENQWNANCDVGMSGMRNEALSAVAFRDFKGKIVDGVVKPLTVSSVLARRAVSIGIGTETARVLALRAVHVPMGVRSMGSGKEVKDAQAIVKEIPTAKIEAMGLDLILLASVRKLASDRSSIHWVFL